jgi:hypothetical protein
MAKQSFLFCLLMAFAVAGCRDTTSTNTGSSPSEAQGPRLTVAEKQFDAGTLDNTKAYEHAFAVTNSGDQPLRLTLVRKSCSCGSVEVPADGIAPRENGKVTFRWTPPAGTVGPYHLRADFETNDPKNPFLTLEVQGNVDPRVRLSPMNIPYLDLDNVLPGQTVEQTLKVFSTRLDQFKLSVKKHPEGLEVTTEPLAEGELIDGVKARSGYRIKVKTTDKLPAGSFRDELVFEVHLPGEAEPKPLKLPVYVTVKNGTCTVTPSKVDFKCQRVTDGASVRVNVQFDVPSDQDKVRIVRVEPAFLTTDEPKELSKGTWRFSVTLPKGNAEAAKHQADGFEGQAVFTTSPGSPEVSLRVNWDPPPPPGK